MGVSALAVLADNLGVVVAVVDKELLGVAVAVDVDLGQSIVQSNIGVAVLKTSLEPGLQKAAIINNKSNGQQMAKEMVWT